MSEDFVTGDQLAELTTVMSGRLNEIADSRGGSPEGARAHAHAQHGRRRSAAHAPAEHDFGRRVHCRQWPRRAATTRPCRLEGKATLAGLSRFVEQRDAGIKATLGSTDATGGWIIPNAMVDEIMKPAEYRRAGCSTS